MTHEVAIPSGWALVALQDAALIRDDLRKPVNAEERAKRVGPYPYYGATGQVGWIDDFLMDGEYVLLGEDGAPFLDPNRPKAYLVSGKSWVNNHAHVLQGVSGKCRNRFLMYALNYVDYRGYANGTTRLKLTQSSMRRLPILLPPVREQDQIVGKIEELFSDLDAGVAALMRVRAKVRRYRAAVLDAAVTGRLTAAWRRLNPPSEPADKLLARLLEERRKTWESGQLSKFAKMSKGVPSNWQDKYSPPASPDLAGLPTLPKGWCWSSIEQLLIRSEYGTSVKCGYQSSGVPVLRIPNIAGGTIDLSDLKFSTLPLELEEGDELRLGDLLMCRTNGSINLIGKTALVSNDFPSPHSFASYLLRFRFLREQHLPAWVHIYLTSGQGRRYIESHAASSAGQHNISLTLIHRMAVPLPTLPEQVQIVAKVERRLSIAEAVATKIDLGLKCATRLRQAILKRAFEGKLLDRSSFPATTQSELTVFKDTDPAHALPVPVFAPVRSSTKKPKKPPTAAKRKEPKGINFRRGAIAAYAIRSLGSSPYFGRTQLEKVLHLTQTHFGIDLSLEFKRHAAGPFDEAIFKVESLATKMDWFSTVKRPSFGVMYRPGARMEDRIGAATSILGNKKAKLDEMLGYMSHMDTEKAELFATVYAAWNDLIIEGRPTDEDDIVAEVHKWHESKRRFTPERIKDWIRWLKKKGFVPSGSGQHTTALEQ